MASKNLFKTRRKLHWLLLLILLLLSLLINYAAPNAGKFLIDNSSEQPFSMAVVLAGGFEERFLELYERHKKGEITEFIFTRSEKTEARKKLEKLTGPLPTGVEISIDVLKKDDVPDEKISIIPQYVLSTRDEAIYVGNFMREKGIKGIAVLTSNYHSRRACWIFRKTNPDLKFSCIAGRHDDFDPNSWWKNRRMIMTVFSEYVKWAGYWIEFLFDKKLAN